MALYCDSFRNYPTWRIKLVTLPAQSYLHVRVDWPVLANKKTMWLIMMPLSSRPWVHGPFSMPHTYARSPWLLPPPIFFPLQDPGSTSCMWFMCTSNHVREFGEPSKTEVHLAPPSDVLLRREGWCLLPTISVRMKVW